MEIKNCVLTIKQTVLARGGRAATLAHQGDATARRIVSSDEEQRRTLDTVREVLQWHKIKFTEISAHTFTVAEKREISAADFVISIGGDGTALSTSHYITSGKLLGVNSAPGDSVGHFCHAQRGNFAERLSAILADRWQPTKLTRLSVWLDDQLLPQPALNDVLIAHDCPAATTRYLIELAGISEEHRSSGIWVATPAGSTAGIKSAGGRVMPIGSRRFQYLVRELYREPHRSYALTKGFVSPEGTLRIASKMQNAHLYIDGARTAYAFPFGARIRVQCASDPLQIFIVERSSPQQ